MSRVPAAWLPFATAEETELPGRDRTTAYEVIENSRFDNPDEMPDDVAAILNKADATRAEQEADEKRAQEEADARYDEENSKW